MPPTAPVQIIANQTGSSAPAAPVQVLPGLASGGASLTYATGTLVVNGNAATGAVEIMGLTYGTEQTTPGSGLTMAETYAAALAAEINADYIEDGLRPLATVSGAVVTLTSGIPGIAGNLVDISSSDALVVASGAALSGGGGDTLILVGGGPLTTGGGSPVTLTFPPLAVNRSEAGVQDAYSNNAWAANTDGADLTGWHYELSSTTVFSGTFPSLVLEGYRWELSATRYTAGTVSESAVWQAATQPSRHEATAATGWAPVSPATGTPTISQPTTQGFAAPPVVTANGSGSTPTAPVQITGNQTTGSTPTAPVQITANGSGSSPTAPVQITGDLTTGSTPTAPVQIAADGSGGTPTAPVQITGNQTGGSTPTAPPIVQA